MKRSVVLIIVVAVVLMLLSCEKTSNPSGKEAVIVKVKLVNSDNEPLAGYNATIYPVLDIETMDSTNNKAYATINFSIPKASVVKVEIFDYYENKLETLCNDTLPSGHHSLVYHPDENVEDGIYKVQFTRVNDGEVTDFLSSYIYKYSKSVLGNDDYVTDEFGEFVETCRYNFPYLYFRDEMDCSDDSGYALGTLNITREVCVKISDNNGQVKTATFNIFDWVNIIELNWDEMTLEDKNFINNETINEDYSSESLSLAKDNDNGDFPPLETNLFVYPNPFN